MNIVNVKTLAGETIELYIRSRKPLHFLYTNRLLHVTRAMWNMSHRVENELELSKVLRKHSHIRMLYYLIKNVKKDEYQILMISPTNKINKFFTNMVYGTNIEFIRITMPIETAPTSFFKPKQQITNAVCKPLEYFITDFCNVEVLKVYKHDINKLEMNVLSNDAYLQLVEDLYGPSILNFKSLKKLVNHYKLNNL